MGYRETLNKLSSDAAGVGNFARLRGDAKQMRKSYMENTGGHVDPDSSLGVVLSLQESGIEPGKARAGKRVRERVEARNPGNQIWWKE
jgi:hypothetical protein